MISLACGATLEEFGYGVGTHYESNLSGKVPYLTTFTVSGGKHLKSLTKSEACGRVIAMFGRAAHENPRTSGYSFIFHSRLLSDPEAYSPILIPATS